MAETDLSGRWSRQQLVILVVFGVLIGVGVTFLAAPSGESPSPANQTDLNRFVTPTYGVSNTFLWSYETGKLPRPVDIRIDTRQGTSQPASELLSKDAEVGFIIYDEMPRLLSQNPDALILPYMLSVPTDILGFYVRENLSINDPSDLAGKRIGFPPVVTTAGMSIEMLADEGVTRANSDFIPVSIADAPSAIEDGVVDAGWVLGDPGNASIRPVFYPFQEMEDRFGQARFPAYFVVSDPSNVRLGSDVMTMVAQGIDQAQTDPSAVAAHAASKSPLSADQMMYLVDILGQDEVLVEVDQGFADQIMYTNGLASGPSGPQVSNVSAHIYTGALNVTLG